MSKDKITHKELLAFSNATNLEWEHVDLEAIKNGEYDIGGDLSDDELSTQLDDILTPEVFIREYDDGTEENVYGVNQDANFNSELGQAEMRIEAGIAMEYLEKAKVGNEEGDFLEDWEVIYGGDRYKILKDYLDEREKVIRKLVEEISDDITLTEEDNLEGSLYPSREEIEEEVDARLRIKYKARLAETGFTIASSFLSGGKSARTILGGDNLLQIGKSLGSDIVKNVWGSEVKDLSPRLHFLTTLLANPGDLELLKFQ